MTGGTLNFVEWLKTKGLSVDSLPDPFWEPLQREYVEHTRSI